MDIGSGANGRRAPPRGDTGGSAGGGGGGGDIRLCRAISSFSAEVGSFPESVRCSARVSASASRAAGETEETGTRGDRGEALARWGDAGGDATATATATGGGASDANLS